MSLKEAVAYTPGDRYMPFGGAKGGIDCDPHDPRRVRRAGALPRRRCSPFLERHWATGEDFGVRQDDARRGGRARLGLRSIEAALLRVDDAPTPASRGCARRSRSTSTASGWASSSAATASRRRRSRRWSRLAIAPAGARAVVQGFGSMGGATARYLAARGRARRRDRRPRRRRRQPGRARRRDACCARATATARSTARRCAPGDEQRARRRLARARRARCSSPPPCRT